MSWFYDLRTTSKFLVCFGGLAVLLGIVGYLGLSAVSESNASVALAYDRDLKGVDLALQGDVELRRAGQSLRQGLQSFDQAGKDTSAHELDAQEKAMGPLISDIRATCVYPQSLDRLDETKRMMVEYFRLGREALRVSGTDYDKASKLSEEANALGVKIGETFTYIGTAKRQVAREEQVRIADRYSRSRAMIALMTVVAVVFAFGCSSLTGRAIATPLRLALEALDRLAAGDLEAHLEVTSKDEVGQLAASLNRSIDSLRSTLVGVQEISTQVSSAATQLAATAEQISGGAQSQAASLEETAASLEEISATVKQNADNAQQAAQLASGARDAAERGGQVVESAVSAMGEITRSSKKIADIITTIDEIAFQTNLLALNAAVEAARAGEQGRGFGVVAAEVRTLSQRTASAAKEIRGLIADSTNKVEVGTQQVNRSGETLGEIVRSVKRVTDMVSEIAAASREQNTGVDQVNTAVTEVDKVTQGNAAETEELSATAMSLADKAGHLEQLVARFELGTPRRGAARATPAPVAAPTPRRRAPERRGAPQRSRGDNLDDSGIRRSVVPAVKTANGFEEF